MTYIGHGVFNCGVTQCNVEPGVEGIKEWMDERMREFDREETTNRSMVSLFGPVGMSHASVQRVGDHYIISFGEGES